MRIVKYPQPNEWKQLLARAATANDNVLEKVKSILEEVKKNGDKALKRFAKKWDNAELTELQVTKEEMEEAVTLVSEELKEAIQQAAKNIEKFHSRQMFKEELVETTPGIVCWRKAVPIEKVGLYIPGGNAPLFSSLLMMGIPAIIAGCRRIVLCTPPTKEGKINPAILYTASLIGIAEIYKTGGAQAIAAMAFGTESIPAVNKIFGPGNNFVTAAKQLVQQYGVAIDMPAGPSEVLVLADETANAGFAAADLLSQAEHGADSQAILVTTEEELALQVQNELQQQLSNLSRKELATPSLSNSLIIITKNFAEAIELVNEYAPEHLIINCRFADVIAEKIVNAGSVFIGAYTPEAAGDYASGTNHVLPTNGFAKAYSGLSIESFVKKISFQKISAEGLKIISSTIITMAEAEGLDAHANAIKIRSNV
ncbi:MAG: histidinol dehydrogenase [Chitinophagaceae bacterium]